MPISEIFYLKSMYETSFKKTQNILAVSSEQPHACNDDCNNGSAKQIQTTNGHQTGKFYFLQCNLDNFNIFLLKTNKIIYL